MDIKAVDEVRTSFAQAFEGRAFVVDENSIPSPYIGTMNLNVYQVPAKRVVVGEADQDLYLRTPSGSQRALKGDKIVLDGEDFTIVKPSSFGRYQKLPPDLHTTEHPHVYLDASHDFAPVVIVGNMRIPCPLIANLMAQGAGGPDVERQIPGIQPGQIYDAMAYLLDHISPEEMAAARQEEATPRLLVPAGSVPGGPTPKLILP